MLNLYVGLESVVGAGLEDNISLKQITSQQNPPEVVEDFDGDTYRAVYTVKFAGTVYVLHAFQKKSKQGIATPKQDIDLIKERLKRSQEHHAERRAKMSEQVPTSRTSQSGESKGENT